MIIERDEEYNAENNNGMIIDSSEKPHEMSFDLDGTENYSSASKLLENQQSIQNNSDRSLNSNFINRDKLAKSVMFDKYKGAS